MLESLLNNLRQGENSALDEIYLITKNYVYALCYSYVKNAAAAEDLMQDTFINILRYILHYKEGTNPKAWIYQIAKNLSINYYNKNKRENIADISLAYNLSGNSEVTAKDENGIIKIAAKILSSVELRILLLHTIADMPHADIAKLLNIKGSTVRWKYRQAIKKLQKRLNKEELL